MERLQKASDIRPEHVEELKEQLREAILKLKMKDQNTDML
jgi:hypothetical protein